jgi:signal transduction histidine kinase
MSSPDGLVGKSDFDVFSDAHARPAYEDEQEIIRTGVPMIGKVERETWLDGRPDSWAFTTKMPLRNRQGEIIGTFGITKDISELKEAERRAAEAHRQMLEASRLAGMAEIATNVLHNVGNVLNSINVSAGLVSARLRASKLKGLARAVGLMNEHAHDLGGFMTDDPKGRMLPGYLGELARTLEAEHEDMAAELRALSDSVDHIKEVVATQQSHAGSPRIVEPLNVSDLVDDALRMSAAALTRHHVSVVQDLADLPLLSLDRHRVLLILINLINNAKYALNGTPEHSRLITIHACLDRAETLTLRVVDNGVGIAAEHLTCIFSHGFTTRKDGHGFGLHSSALAAGEMGGRLTATSDGPGKGACFVLELPIHRVETAAEAGAAMRS